MLDFEINTKINYDATIDKKWSFLQYAYIFWTKPGFNREPLKIVENNGNEITIYLNLTKNEFLHYCYFLDIKEAHIRGKDADCFISFEDGSVNIKFYDKMLSQQFDDIVDEMNSVIFDSMPDFEFKTCFYAPFSSPEFYEKLILFIYYLSEINVQEYGIKICDLKGEFQSYTSTKFPRENLDKFVYYDGTIFIGSHARNNMIVIFNLPKNKFLELNRWCREYEE